MYSENGNNGMVMPVAPYAGGYGGSTYADGYSQGYSEAMNQMNGNSGHYPMPPYYPTRRY